MDTPMNEADAIAAIEALDAPQTQDDQAAAEIEAIEPEAEAEPTEAPEGEEPEAEAEEVEEAEPIAPPQYWDAEDKEIFAAYPREVQEKVLEQEAKREAVTARLKSEAKESKARFEQETEALRGLVTKLDQVVPNELASFEAKYGGIDWQAYPQWARENPQEALVFQAEYEAEKLRLNETLRLKAEAEQKESAAFARQTAERLAEIAPDLAKNPEALKELGAYLGKTGLPAEAVNKASAEELVILNKAMLYDKLTKDAEARTSAAKPKQPPVKTVKPVAAQSSGTHSQRQISEAAKSFRAKPSDDLAIELISKMGL